MKITILNGNPAGPDSAFDAYLARLNTLLTTQGHSVTSLPLREMDIRYCIGCFGCWVKTPGACFSPDESGKVCQAIIASDFTLWASPLRMGFPSALLKKMMDKSIPLLHPYFVVDHNEAHHRPRYDRYPRFGLLLSREADSDAEDIRLVTDIHSRTALNSKSRLEFALVSDDCPVEEVVNAITHPNRKSISPDFHPTPTSGVRVTPPYRLTVFNGSPRGRKGNTPIMLNQFMQGFTGLPGHSAEMFHLNRQKEAARFPQAFNEAECVLLGFPLYTDSMPGIVKAFIEALEPYCGRLGKPPIGFLVQSGFPEANHSRHVEHYLKKLADRLGSPYLGTIVKGGGEGTRLMPENMNRNLFTALFQLGQTFGQSGQLDAELLRRLASPERYPAYLAPIFRLYTRLPAASSYWDAQLKENRVFEQRFARPYSQ